jgi:putative addiction module CopG family antidote
MQISLTSELEKLIQGKVSSRRYASTIQVIGESLRLLDERDRAAKTRLIELKQKI